MIGVCAANSGVIVVSFSIEDSHPHVLLYGTRSGCACFKNLFETLYRHFATKTRDGSVQSTFHCELYWIGDEDYLRNVGVYTVIQATKDGKPVMPYDYRWGTGSMYFRSPHHIPLWLIDDDGIIHDPAPFGSLPARDKRRVLHSQQIPCLHGKPAESRAGNVGTNVRRARCRLRGYGSPPPVRGGVQIYVRHT